MCTYIRTICGEFGERSDKAARFWNETLWVEIHVRVNGLFATSARWPTSSAVELKGGSNACHVTPHRYTLTKSIAERLLRRLEGIGNKSFTF